MSRNRSEASRARQRRALIRDAIAVIDVIPESRMAALGAPSGLDAAAARADYRRFATERPRDVLTTFSREASAYWRGRV
ncbi:hypothetical protein [Lysobacter enzymogenes]|uniref:hypothetical protein n=1 Tax=Lysobacter enzymogenes TaxID=69 RepID=UPI0011140CFD|nr:hypothetical protein [Lysobacter enzymogenes]